MPPHFRYVRTKRVFKTFQNASFVANYLQEILFELSL